MKTLFEKRYRSGKQVSYEISSDNPRTLALALPPFLILLALAVGCFAAVALVPGREALFAAGFALSIAAAIGWMFFALHYGKRHFEKGSTLSTSSKGERGAEKGKQT